MKTVKVTKGNDFCLYIPLVVLNASGAVPVQTSDLSGISVTYKTGCGVAASVIPTYVENYMVLTFPDTLAVGVYSLDITGMYSQRDIRKHINECFAVVEWDSQSNWRDYLVGDHVVTDTQAFIGVLYTNAEYQAKIEELNIKIAQAEATKAAYEAKVAMLDGVAQQTTMTAVKTETDKIGSASAGKPQTLFGAIEGIEIDTSSLAQRTDVKDGNDTAISVAKAVKTETDKIGIPASGQQNTLFGAIAACGTVSDIVNAIRSAGLIPINYGGLTFNVFPQPSATYPLYYYRNNIKEIIDNDTTSFPYAILNNDQILSKLTMGKLEQINSNLAISRSEVTYLSFPVLTYISGASVFYSCTKLEEVLMPNLLYAYRGQKFYNCPILKKLDISRIKYLDQSDSSFGETRNLIDIKFGVGLDTNFNISGWDPTNALLTDSTTLVEEGETFSSNREKLLYNIREHIAANLQDRSETTSKTITFSANIKAAIDADQQTKDAFTSKNWNIA